MKFRGISIHKHKSCNTWYARFRQGGKQFYVSARTQQDCYDKLKSALMKKSKEILKLKEPEANQITFAEWFTKWLELYKQSVKQGTRKEYFLCLKHLEKIKDKPINKITAVDIIEQLNKIQGGRTKQKVYEFASALFQKAFINEFINKNPMLSIDKPKHKRINGKALTNTDEKELEEILIKNNADMFLVCLYQGLRRGEMLALTVEDIDFENKTLTVNKSFNKQNEVDTTKNIYSVRTMPLFDKTLKVLEKYKDKKGRLFEETQRSCERKFDKIIAELNKKYTIHSLRHTFITRCQEANIPLHIIQKWVGHNIGSNVTSAVYTHTRNDAELENISIYNKKLNSN